MIDFLLLAVGLVGVVVSAWLVVRSAIDIANRFGVPPYVVGFTLVAFGTSLPELLVSVVSTLRGSGDLCLGNVLGSNVANVGLALAASLLFSGLAPKFEKRIFKLEYPVLILAHVLLYAFLMDGVLARIEAFVLFAGVISLMAFVYQAHPSDVPEESSSPLLKSGLPIVCLTLLLGCGLLYFSSEVSVHYAVSLARGMGISERVIGVTVVAIGTSLPEVATCIIAAIDGHHRVSIGLILGSNLINLGCVLAVASLINPIVVQSSGMNFDIAFALGASVVIILTAMVKKQAVRFLGIGLLLGYVSYLYLSAST